MTLIRTVPEQVSIEVVAERGIDGLTHRALAYDPDPAFAAPVLLTA